jgi:hypothetical protein
VFFFCGFTPLAKHEARAFIGSMKESEEIVFTVDGEDAFGDFGNPEWVAKMLKKAKEAEERRKRAALEKRPKVETADAP